VSTEDRWSDRSAATDGSPPHSGAGGGAEPACEPHDPLGTPSASAGVPPASSPSRRRRLAIASVAVLVVVAAVVAGIAVFRSSIADAIATGHGTATITWTPASGSSQPPQPFSGTVDGRAVSGVATSTISASDVPSTAGSPATLPSRIQAFRWKGQFGGKPYDLEVDIVGAGGSSGTGFTRFEVTGTYANRAVRCTAPVSSSSGSASTAPIHFSGTVGSYKVSGAVPQPSGNGSKQTATATFTVTG